jgi:transposase
MRRYELTDEQYALLEPYLPRMQRTGGHLMERSPAGAEWAVLEAAVGRAMARHP